jgi:hypothetical protein
MPRRFGSYVVDHPSFVTITLAVVVIAQFVLAKIWLPFIAPSSLFHAVKPIDLPTSVSSLAIGVAGVAAMVGGFAGVVVVFGLSSNDVRFRKVRVKASTSLRRNWMSIVTTPLAAAFGAVIAATLASATWTGAALWVLEVCVLLALHGALRLVVLLSELVKVVHAGDEAEEISANTIDVDAFLGD